jgi:zinc protease
MKHIGLAVALLVCAAAVAAAADDASRVRSITLRNGLQVLLLPDPQATAANVAVWYRAGTRTEAAGRTGMSRMVGLLMYGGSSPAAEERRRLQAGGATFNATVNPDYSCFQQTLPCESVELALRLEADHMKSLSVTQDDLEAERGAVREEQRRRLAGNTVGPGLRKLYAVAFADHPYSRPVNGLEEDLERITLEDAQTYFRERYAPQNALLTVVGCFDPEPTLAAVRRYFEPLAPRPSPRPPALRLQAQRGERRGFETAPAPGPLLLVGWRGPGSADPDGPALELLSLAISSGPSSRLSRLRAAHPGLVALAQGDFDRSREASLIFCMAAVPARAESAAAESVFVAGIERLAVQPVSDEELDRVKRKAEAARVFGLQTVRGRAEALGAAQILDGDYGAAAKQLDRIRGLTAADLKRAAARVLQAGARSVVWIMPPQAPEASPAPGGRGGRP